MNLSVGLTTSHSAEKIKWIAEKADSLDLFGVWIGEDIGRPQEIFTSTSLVLLGSKKAKAGIGIASPLIRNVTTIARASATLQEIAPERFRLGLGIGGIQDLNSMGIQIKKPIEFMRRTIVTLRAIWKREVPKVRDEEFRLDYKPHYTSSPDLPIFIGARGPKLLALAAEIADGVILSGPRKYIEESIRLIKEKRANSNISSSEFTFVLWVPTILTREEGDLDLVKKTVAIVVADTPDIVLDMTDIPKNDVEEIKIEIKKTGLDNAAKRVTKRMVDQFCIRGDAEGLCEVFRSYSSLGIDEVVFGPPYGRKSKEAIIQVAQAWRG